MKQTYKINLSDLRFKRQNSLLYTFEHSVPNVENGKLLHFYFFWNNTVKTSNFTLQRRQI